MIVVDVTWLGYFMTLVSMYYVVLFIFSMGGAARRDPEGGRRPPMAIIVPAHDEEAVIVGTLESLLGLDYDRFCVIVVNDGSTDGTADRARAFEAIGRVRVVDRPPEVAGRGKGAVLNEGTAFSAICLTRVTRWSPASTPTRWSWGSWMPTATSSLALHHVARLFADPRVGGVQMGVIIGNAEDGLMPRCQDLEFVGFSQLAQAARDRIGSVGLGGNGQFTRLVALQSLGVRPGRTA